MIKMSLSEDDKVVLDKIKSKISLCEKKGIPVYTDFIYPHHIEMGTSMMKELSSEIDFFTFGGFDEAERKILIFYPKYIGKDDIDLPIKVIRIVSDSKSAVFKHRDVLGSILGLGIKREKVGDILIKDNNADVILYKEAAGYLMLFLNKISNIAISCYEISFDDISPLDVQYKMIHSTVASLRIDAIISCGLNESRSHSSEYIKSNRVKVNYKEVVSPAYILKESDLISVRGKGRLVLEKIEGTTKKDRIRVLIKRII